METGTTARGRITILYDQERCQAVLLHGTRPIGRIFSEIRAGDLIVDAKALAGWFLFGLRLLDQPPEDLHDTEFVSLRNCAVALATKAGQAASTAGLTEEPYARRFFMAAFRQQLEPYMLALLRYRREGQSIQQVADRVNEAFESWHWLADLALAELEAELDGTADAIPADER